MKRFYKLSTLTVVLLIGAAVALFPSDGGSVHYTDVLGIDISGGTYRDGEYYGTAEAFRPGLRVKVIILRGVLESVEIIEHNEIGRRYWSLPMKAIPKEVVQRQTTDLDAVSGATATSYGILAAVEAALAQAAE